MRSVDFFIIGAQKGGTTALDSYLRRSPFVQMADLKEVHFIDNDSLDWSDPTCLSFHEHFEWSQTSGVIRGEATPIYMYWPNAMERIGRYNAAAKLILCLRHPAYRAHSHWRMEIMRSAETLSFENAISRAGRRRVRNAEGGVHRVYSYVERASTPLRFVDCCSYSENTLSRVYRFLNVAPAALAETAYIVPLCSDEIGAISETAFAEIEEHFRDGF